MSEQPVIGHMSEVTSVSLNTANKPINRIIPAPFWLQQPPADKDKTDHFYQIAVCRDAQAVKL